LDQSLEGTQLDCPLGNTNEHGIAGRGSGEAPKYQATWAVNSADSLFWIDCRRGDASQVSDNQHSPDIHGDYNRCLYPRVRKHVRSPRQAIENLHLRRHLQITTRCLLPWAAASGEGWDICCPNPLTLSKASAIETCGYVEEPDNGPAGGLTRSTFGALIRPLGCGNKCFLVASTAENSPRTICIRSLGVDCARYCQGV
jgi:hypothetical protein